MLQLTHLAKGFMSTSIEPLQSEGTVWSQFLPVAAQSLMVLLLLWGLFPLCCRSAGGQGAATMERRTISLLPLAEEAPQKQWGPLQLALPSERRVGTAHPTNIHQDILSAYWNFQPWLSIRESSRASQGGWDPSFKWGSFLLPEATTRY